MTIDASELELRFTAESVEELALLRKLLAKIKAKPLALEPSLERVLELARAQGELTSSEVAASQGISLNTASMRLKRLFQMQLLSRYIRTLPNGQEYVYMPLTLDCALARTYWKT